MTVQSDAAAARTTRTRLALPPLKPRPSVQTSPASEPEVATAQPPKAAGRRFAVDRPRAVLVVAVFLAGAVVRTWGWPHLPSGLNQDEMSSGYEAWSLLTTGADRWGARWPAYFASWGSGQNVLYSYLSIPAIAVFGLVPSALRIVQLVAGLLAVTLAYPVGEHARRGAGIWAMLLVALSPWHFMASRWALESNLLPCLILLGLFTFGSALRSSGRWIPLALAPFGVALYAYGIAVVPIAVFLVLVLALRHRRIREALRAWSAATAILLIVAAPFSLALLKTYVVKAPLPLESLLPFSLPDQSATRLSEVAGSFPLLGNLSFVSNGFDDHLPWNSLPDWVPISPAVVALAVGELIWVIAEAVRRRSSAHVTLIDLLALGTLPLLVILPFNVNQGNVIAIALLLLAAKAVAHLISTPATVRNGRVAATIAAVLIAGNGALAFLSYTGPAYASTTESNFNPGVGDALRRANALVPTSPMYVTESLNGGYVQTLWYLRVPPEEFRRSEPTFGNPNFGRYLFHSGDLQGVDQFSFAVRSGEAMPCAAPSQVVDAQGWVSGVCTTA